MTTCPYAVFSRDPDTVDRHLQRLLGVRGVLFGIARADSERSLWREATSAGHEIAADVLDLATEAVDPRMERDAGMAMEESIAA
jgi:hypothetical protein